ncbi:MAG: helix-turn-helix domain-containing protein [Candidatus Omnitrophota bacterium]
MKKILLKITVIILMQAMLLNCAWAQGIEYAPERSTLAPQMNLPVNNFMAGFNKLLTEIRGPEQHMIKIEENFNVGDVQIEQRRYETEPLRGEVMRPVVGVTLNGKNYWIGNGYHLAVTLPNGKKIYWGGEHNLSYSFFFEHYRDKAKDIINKGGLIWKFIDAHKDLGRDPLPMFVHKRNDWRDEVKAGYSTLLFSEFLRYLLTRGLASKLYMARSLDKVSEIIADRKVSVPGEKCGLKQLAAKQAEGGVADIDIDIVIGEDGWLPMMERGIAEKRFEEMKPYLLSIAENSELCFLSNSSEITLYFSKRPAHIEPSYAVAFNAQLVRDLAERAQEETMVFRGRKELQQQIDMLKGKLLHVSRRKVLHEKIKALEYLMRTLNAITVQDDNIFIYPVFQEEAVATLKRYRTKFIVHFASPDKDAGEIRKNGGIVLSAAILNQAVKDSEDNKVYGRARIPAHEIVQAILLARAAGIDEINNIQMSSEAAEAIREFYDKLALARKLDEKIIRDCTQALKGSDFSERHIKQAVADIDTNKLIDYGFAKYPYEDNSQFEQIIQDFKNLIGEKQKKEEKKEVVIYAIGLGKEPTEAVELVEMFNAAVLRTLGKEKAKEWTVRLIGIDINEEPLEKARPVFEAINNKRYFDKPLAVNIQMELACANALDVDRLQQIGKSGKADYVFHRHVTYFNKHISQGAITIKDINHDNLPYILNAYLSIRNILSSLCKENTRYVTDPVDSALMPQMLQEEYIPVLRIPGAVILTNNHFFGSNQLPEDDLMNRGTGIYLIKNPGNILEVGLKGFCEGIAKQQDFEGRRIRREDVTRELERNGWNVLQAAAVFGTNTKRIRSVVGRRTIEQGRKKIKEREKEMIICALEAYGWNVKEAANALEIYPSRIYNVLTLNFIRTGRKKAALILREKVKAVLKGHNWNVLETSRDPLLLELRLGPSEINTILSRGWIARQRKQYNDEQAEKEKREIIKAIKMFLKHNDCLIKVAQYLGIARATLNDKLARYSISFTDMKFDEDRVVPVLKLTKGNVSRAGQRLGIDAGVLMERFGIQIEKIKKEHEENIRKQRTVLVADAIEAQRGDKARTAAEIGIAEKTLHEWMDKYYLFEISPATLHAYRLEVKLMVIDNIFSNIKQKAFSLDRSNENAARMFHRTSDFHLFRAAEIMKGLDAYIEKVYPAFELAAKINACGRTIKSLQTFIVNHQPGKSAEYLFLIDRLEDIIETVDFYERDMEKLGFTSFSAKPDARTARLSNEELINDIRKAMPSSKSKNPDWRQFNILIEELKLRDGVDVIVEKDEINQAWFSPRAYIRNLSMGEDNFIRYAAENIAQHVEHGTALVIRQKFKDYTQITVMDNGDGFVNRYNNGKVKVEDAIICKRSFGSKKGYAGVFQNHGQALTLVVSYPDISIIKQPGESAIILPAISENSRIPIIEPQVVSGAENAKKIGTEITGYFYNQPNEFVRKKDWRSYLAQKLRSKLSAEMPALKNKKAKVNKFNLLVEQAI